MSMILAGGGIALALAGGYLLGSIPFAIIVSRLMRLRDPRSFGSGNPGATNVLRSGNKLAAILTLAGDAAKGWLAVALAYWCQQQGWLSPAAVPLAGLAAVLGHLYSLFLHFRGGRGVATALGVLLGLQPWLAAATAITWAVTALIWRYSSLAAIVAAVLAPVYYVLGADTFWRTDAVTASVIALVAVLVLIRHKANITRLLTGKESRIGNRGVRGKTH